MTDQEKAAAGTAQCAELRREKQLERNARALAALAALVGNNPVPGAFGKVSVHITPAQDDNALPVGRWVHDAQALIACLRAIEPAAQVRINVAGVGAMHHVALHDTGVDVGMFVKTVDYAPALALIPEALRPCTRCDLPAKHTVLGGSPSQPL